MTSLSSTYRIKLGCLIVLLKDGIRFDRAATFLQHERFSALSAIFFYCIVPGHT